MIMRLCFHRLPSFIRIFFLTDECLCIVDTGYMFVIFIYLFIIQ